MNDGCKLICKQYKAKKPINEKRYEVGQKRCSICDIFMIYDKYVCPCCNVRLRTTPKNRSKSRRIS